MEACPQKRLSLDTNVLFDLADGQDFAHNFRETYQRKAYALVIFPTPPRPPLKDNPTCEQVLP